MPWVIDVAAVAANNFNDFISAVDFKQGNPTVTVNFPLVQIFYDKFSRKLFQVCLVLAVLSWKDSPNIEGRRKMELPSMIKNIEAFEGQSFFLYPSKSSTLFPKKLNKTRNRFTH